MYIDTSSRQMMTLSMTQYLDISVNELREYIEYAFVKASGDNKLFNSDIFFREMEDIVSDLQPEPEIDDILFFHL